MDDLSMIFSDLPICIPVYQEDPVQLNALKSVLSEMGAEVIIVDDGSKEPFPDAIKHGCNYGYGAALMTGIRNATRPIVMTIDGDMQHQVEDVVKLYKVWKMLDVDMVIGARRLKYEKFIRMFGRKCLNFIASLFTGIYMQDLNSGMRIFKKETAIGYFPILCKKFSFTTSITISYMCDEYKVEWFPIQVRERVSGKSHVRIIEDGIRTLFYIIKIGFALRTRRIRGWIRRNLFLKSI